MPKKAVFIILAVFCTYNIYAVSFNVNGEQWKERTRKDLAEISYPIPFGTQTLTGISLDELFPAVFEAWTLNISSTSAGNSVKLTDPELGNDLNRIYLITQNNETALLYKNRLYTGIKSIDLGCEELERKGLEIWINWEGIELLRAEISRYAEMHDIEIRVNEVPKPDSKLVSVTQANGTIPDVVMVQSSYINKLVRSGSLHNLDYMYPNSIVQQGKDAFSLDDKVWAIPFYYDTQLLFCNPEIITPPEKDWNFDDFEALCEKALSLGKIPAAWNSYSASFLIPFQMAFGKSKLIESDGSIIIDDLPSLNALEYVLRLQNDGLMQPMERDAMTSLFVSGDAAMIISASYSIPHFEQLGIPFTAVPLPINSSTGIRLSPLLDFKAFAITKRSHNSPGARRLIEFLCGIGVQQRFTEATAKLPALEMAWLTTESGNPYFEALSISAEAGTVIPTDKAYSIYKNTMWKMLRFAISGQMPAIQVLERTQSLVDKNLSD